MGKPGKNPHLFTISGGGKKGRCFHRDHRTGYPAYDKRYDYVGKFMHVGNGEYLAVARLGKQEFHITPKGKPAYRMRFRHVDDFFLISDQHMAMATRSRGKNSLLWFPIQKNGRQVEFSVNPEI